MPFLFFIIKNGEQVTAHRAPGALIYALPHSPFPHFLFLLHVHVGKIPPDNHKDLLAPFSRRVKVIPERAENLLGFCKYQLEQSLHLLHDHPFSGVYVPDKLHKSCF